MKILAAILFLVIVYSMASALYYMYKDTGNSTRMVRSLSIRIGVSIALFVIMMTYSYFTM
ncbi:MAG: twin transmembrane helix small protein [Nitrosomonas sp.]|nr:twin transmembrane helix small protein [Nitrosomonas sp.]